MPTFVGIFFWVQAPPWRGHCQVPGGSQGTYWKLVGHQYAGSGCPRTSGLFGCAGAGAGGGGRLSLVIRELRKLLLLIHRSRRRRNDGRSFTVMW